MKIELNRAGRTGLMVSVSALTILIASERGLEAQADEWWMSVEGQYLLFEDDGSFGGPVPDDGWGGRLKSG